MKTLSSALAAHLAQAVTTLAWCWKLTRADGVVLGFTDHDRALDFDGVTYEAATGFVATEIASSLGLSVDNLDVEGALSSGAITEADIAAGLYDGARVEVWRVNWADPDERVLMRSGAIGEVTRGELAFTAELRGLAHTLDQAVGRTYQRTCDAVVGDNRCGVDLEQAAYRGTGTVTAVADNRTITTGGLSAHETGWFGFGRLTWTSGANAGTSAEVRSHQASDSSATLDLWQRAPLPIDIGDAFKVTAGCDKTVATCKAKFDNVLNFRGFPHMPGTDRAFSYVVGQTGENDGGSFFK